METDTKRGGQKRQELSLPAPVVREGGRVAAGAAPLGRKGGFRDVNREATAGPRTPPPAAGSQHNPPKKEKKTACYLGAAAAAAAAETPPSASAPQPR